MGSQITGHGTGTRTPLSKGLSLSVPFVSLGECPQNVPRCPMSHGGDGIDGKRALTVSRLAGPS
jgi:hypothetical protein